ncbi:glycosyltransferase family 2 protein [Candidatus Poribacteria bacterium]|nr:glycosyltransferase family 2 protein [Candidatus Poribacteria bacterium]
MSDSPLVSIITPAWNAAPFIAETIASVQAQTWTNWELLISDDGSDDATPDIVAEASQSDPRVRLLTMPLRAGHAATARNNSLRAARGEFIAFLDADDLWDPDKLEHDIQFLIAHPEVDAVCSYYRVFGDPDRARRWEETMRYFPPGPVTPAQVLQQCGQTSTIVMRRRVFETLGPMDEHPGLRSGQDNEYFTRMALLHTCWRLEGRRTAYRVAALRSSLSTSHDFAALITRAWTIHERLVANGAFAGRPGLRRRHRCETAYSIARDNLFTHGGPWRSWAWRAVLSGGVSLKALVVACVTPLPSAWARRVLTRLLALIQRPAP